MVTGGLDMEDKSMLKLTTAEITSLWGAYMNDSSIVCKFSHFLAQVEDKETMPLIQKALDIARGNLETLTEIFKKEDYKLPKGFSISNDVDISAPRLYSDTYVLNYLHNATQIALQGYSLNLSLAVRSDIFSYFNECTIQLTTFLREVKELLLDKGLYIRSPYLPKQDHIDIVHKENFLTGFFGEKRPLLVTEITNFYHNYQRNALGVATLIGFSQVAQSREVVEYLIRGKEIAKKHCEVFDSFLKKGDIPVPTTWDSEVTESTAYTYSDKLMMFYTTALTALGVGYYGSGLAMSPRRDIGVMYSRLSGEILKYAEDGAEIMIKNGWLEQPPMAPDRNELARRNNR
jgi:Protein of unknown function (DUF3231)